MPVTIPCRVPNCSPRYDLIWRPDITARFRSLNARRQNASWKSS